MIDDSGSTIGTDPSNSYRINTIQTFLNQYGSKPNFTYSYNVFADGVISYDPAVEKFVMPDKIQQRFGTADDLKNALSAFQTLTDCYHSQTNRPPYGYDGSSNLNFIGYPVASYPSSCNDVLSPGGGTSYGSAFAALQALIAADASSNPSQNYVVIFMSDGVPTDYVQMTKDSSQSQVCSDEFVIDDTIKQSVDQLNTTALSGSGNSFVLSSVFFGQASTFPLVQNPTCSDANAYSYSQGIYADSWAHEHLQVMATEGNGQFTDVNQGTSFSIQDIINSTVQVCSP
jgi:hypothetical protein